MEKNGTFRIGIKAGSFTLLHAGHVRALQYCAERCDYLIVLTNTDDRIFRKKGCVPLPLDQRIQVLRSIKGVDDVTSFEEETEETWVSNFKQTLPKKSDNCKLIVFHDPEVSRPAPCETIVDEIVFVPHLPAGGPKYSVTNMFEMIDRRNHG